MNIAFDSGLGRAAARHRVIAIYRAQRLVFRRWWRSKPAFDFFYCLVLKKRCIRDIRELALGAERVCEPKLVDDLLKRLRPKEIAEELQRIGGASDGGYLLPLRATAVDAVFSPGVGDEAGFEAWFASRHVPCFLADASVEQAPLDFKEFNFVKKFIGNAADATTLEVNSWIETNAPESSNKLGLQIDIEGGEYEVLPAIKARNIARFHFMIIEFHNLHRIVDRTFATIVTEILDLIDKTHVIVHTHANNSSPPIRWKTRRLLPTVEIVAVRKELVTVTGNDAKLPHAKDKKNVRWRRDWPFRG